MSIQSFDSFLSTLDEEKMKEIYETDTDCLNLSVSLTDPSWGTKFGAAICTYSSAVTLKLLKSYHEWLQKQIS